MSQIPVKGSKAQQGWERATSKAFGQNLGQAIARRSLTLSEAGRRIGVSHATVSTWASGKVLPEWPNMAALCVALNISLGELFDGAYDKRPLDERFAEQLDARVRPVREILEGLRLRLDDVHHKVSILQAPPDPPETPER